MWSYDFVHDVCENGRKLKILTVVDESRVADVGTIADRPVYEPDPSPLEHVEDVGDLGTAG